ncbi:uncharacterized protein LOC131235020 [Magnolia sinica]|uniref:uncharacterized protein LOC131235020 n=1 Tax=Magnolia sinica TaxID=86752 RepID=UPI00265A6533|nr:uncharacterized protein LOC131235020 [Magnolia sinica]XP_058088080.1 uncharacterized protein LOC131235020 [Magnolia sinica]
MSWKRRSCSHELVEEPDDEDEDDNDEWLELGLGTGNSRTSPSPSPSQPRPDSLPSRGPDLGLELGLGFGDDDDDGGGVRRSGAGLCLAPPAHFNHGHHHHHMVLGQHGSCSASLPSSSLPSSPWHMDLAGPFNGEVVPRTGSGPCGRRPGSGVWFCLRTSDSRRLGGEALPQIPKAYIRVKDENVTIFMVKTYLIRKLGLTSEAEIDISCMGRKLSHSQTLKHVRDAVWLPGVIELLNRTSSTENDHVSLDQLMSLCYERRYFFG